MQRQFVSNGWLAGLEKIMMLANYDLHERRNKMPTQMKLFEFVEWQKASCENKGYFATDQKAGILTSASWPVLWNAMKILIL